MRVLPNDHVTRTRRHRQDGTKVRQVKPVVKPVESKADWQSFLDLPHRLYRLEDKDVVLRLPVTPWEAALGSTLQVPTLSGTVDLKIKPGIQSGQKMRLKGKGMPGTPAGDQFVEIMIHTAPAEDDSEREFYEQMRDRFDFNPRSF